MLNCFEITSSTNSWRIRAENEKEALKILSSNNSILEVKNMGKELLPHEVTTEWMNDFIKSGKFIGGLKLI